MRKLSSQLARAFSSALMQQERAGERDDCLNWLRYYLDFCAKYHHPPRRSDSLLPFLQEMASKNRSKAQQEQAVYALTVFYSLMAEWPKEHAESRAQMDKEAPWNVCIENLEKEITLPQYSPKTLTTYRQWIFQFAKF